MTANEQHWVLCTIEGFDSKPSLEKAAQHLAVAASVVDSEFGVVLLDPKRGMYCVQILEDHCPDAIKGPRSSGPWSSPRIEGFK